MIPIPIPDSDKDSSYRSDFEPKSIVYKTGSSNASEFV